MDITSTVRSDALPAVGGILVPGAIAITPYVLFMGSNLFDPNGFIAKSQGFSAGLAAILIVSVGIFIESIGTYLEYYVIDNFHGNKENMQKEWWDYLKIAWNVEPIGQQYLRKVLIIFKFELNMCVATTLCFPALFYAWHNKMLPEIHIKIIFFITIIFAVIFLKTSIDSSRLLATLRKMLIKQAIDSGLIVTSSSSIPIVVN